MVHTKDILKKRGSTLFLRAAVLSMGGTVLAVCIFALPAGIRSGAGNYLPILLGMYVPAAPFFIALHQILKLLNLIDGHKAFSGASIKALKYIKYCAVVIGALYAAGMPYIFYAAENDDAPGVIVLGLFVIFASFVIATCVAVMQKLLQSAVDMKSEHDLTV